MGKPYLVSAHLKAHEKFPDESVGVIGHLSYPPDVQLSPLKILGNGSVLLWADSETMEDRPLGWNYFTGGHISVKRSILEKAGGFNERWFGYCDGFEDSELGSRLCEEFGFSIRYEPRALTYHYHWREPEEVLENARRYGRSLGQWIIRQPEMKGKALTNELGYSFFNEGDSTSPCH